jgi:hypothetical protein
MNITIHQTLHGYQNGHQLLASSIPLDSELSKVLLFQSDLSGSLSNTNFETYLTGYPIAKAGVYAIARTWYAKEMKRPGCVWTHTLLIKFPDLGKIPELVSLIELFKRPSSGFFSDYQVPLEVDFNQLVSISESISNANISDALYANTYQNGNRALIIPSVTPDLFENQIVNLWSNQWPRLRRNFYFCTGALSLKSLGERLFDVQVVPLEIVKSVMRTHPDMQQYNSAQTPENWFTIYKSAPKNTIRRFLWNYGSDIDGRRTNFVPLVRLYHLIYIDKDVSAIESVLRQYFPSSKQAKNLKSKIFSDDSILLYPGSERDIVLFLLNLTEIEYLELVELNIERRLINLVQNGKISISELLNIVANSPAQRLSDNIWNDLEVDEQHILELLETNYEMALPFVLRSDSLIYSISTWQLTFQVQRTIFSELYNNRLINDWNRLTRAALEVKSDIVFEFFWKHGDAIIYYALDWFNEGKPDQQFSTALSNFITKEKDYAFIKWLRKNERKIHSKVFALIFNNLSSKKVVNLSFNHNTWLSAYRKLKLTEYQGNIPYIASLLLTIGFNNEKSGADWLVSVTFQDVYDFAGNMRINDQVWNMIPKEYDDDPEADEMGFIESILSALRVKPKKNFQVESWDYQENLIRTLCNKTVKFNWNPGAFLNTLKDQQTFYRAVNYCVSMKKGHSFIIKILKHIDNKQIKFEPFQYQYLRKIKK